MQSIQSSLRRTLLAHAIVSLVVGAQHLLAPRVWTDLAGIQISETVTWRVIGAGVLAFGLASWLALRDGVWPRVRIVVATQIAWSFLGAAAILWGLLLEGVPPLEWVNALVMLAFGFAFAWSWRRETAPRT